MTAISSTTVSGPYVGTGSQVAFPFTFTAASTLEVGAMVGGVDTTSFSVVLSGTGGTVTFNTAPAYGASVLLYSKPDFLQASNFESEGDFDLDTVNSVNERSAIRDLYLKKTFDRTLRLPFPETVSEFLPAAARANTILGFDSSGSLVNLPGSSSVSNVLQAQRNEYTASAGQTVFTFSYAAYSGFVDVYLNGVRLQEADYTHVGATVTLAVAAAAGDVVTLSGFINAVVGSGTFNFQQTGTGAVSRTAEAKLRERVTVGDTGGATQLQQVQNAIDDLAAAGGGRITIPNATTMTLAGNLNMKTGVYIDGDGQRPSKLDVISGSVVFDSIERSGLSNLRMGLGSSGSIVAIDWKTTTDDLRAIDLMNLIIAGDGTSASSGQIGFRGLATGGRLIVECTAFNVKWTNCDIPFIFYDAERNRFQSCYIDKYGFAVARTAIDSRGLNNHYDFGIGCGPTIVGTKAYAELGTNNRAFITADIRANGTSLDLTGSGNFVVLDRPESLTPLGNIGSGNRVFDQSTGRMFTSGTQPLAGNMTFDAGFGATTSAAFAANSSDQSMEFTVTVAGAGCAANPRLYYAFKDGNWPHANPKVFITRSGGNQMSVVMDAQAASATGFNARFVGTPVAGEQYVFKAFVL